MNERLHFHLTAPNLLTTLNGSGHLGLYNALGVGRWAWEVDVGGGKATRGLPLDWPSPAISTFNGKSLIRILSRQSHDIFYHNNYSIGNWYLLHLSVSFAYFAWITPNFCLFSVKHQQNCIHSMSFLIFRELIITFIYISFDVITFLTWKGKISKILAN